MAQRLLLLDMACREPIHRAPRSPEGLLQGVCGRSEASPVFRWVCLNDERHVSTDSELATHWATWKAGLAGLELVAERSCAQAQPLLRMQENRHRLGTSAAPADNKQRCPNMDEDGSTLPMWRPEMLAQAAMCVSCGTACRNQHMFVCGQSPGTCLCSTCHMRDEQNPGARDHFVPRAGKRRRLGNAQIVVSPTK